jgi:hypothetical protein
MTVGGARLGAPPAVVGGVWLADIGKSARAPATPLHERRHN